MIPAAGVTAVGSGTAWDARRNTSMTHGVSPLALGEALGSLKALRRNDPALVRWLLDGHPTMTAAERVERFGDAYQRRAPSRKSQAA